MSYQHFQNGYLEITIQTDPKYKSIFLIYMALSFSIFLYSFSFSRSSCIISRKGNEIKTNKNDISAKSRQYWSLKSANMDIYSHENGSCDGVIQLCEKHLIWLLSELLTTTPSSYTTIQKLWTIFDTDNASKVLEQNKY